MCLDSAEYDIGVRGYMKDLSKYSLMCSLTNLGLVFILTCTTSILVWLIGEAKWWVCLIVGFGGLLIYGYLVQWWLSRVVNSILHRLFAGDKNN